MSKIQSRKFFGCARFVFALLNGIVCISNANAQQQQMLRYENRMLLVFDTSWAMKARIPKTQAAMMELLSRLSTNGQLRTGDTVGVWMFAQDVTTGKLPLQVWNPNVAATIVSNIIHSITQ